MKLCYIGRVPTNWWPRRVLCALWTRRPIVKVAMGCRTEPAAVHIAHVLQRLDFFQFSIFCYNLQDLPQKKITRPYRKNRKIHFFFHNSHDLPQKKLHAFTAKKITRLDDFLVNGLHFSLLWVMIRRLWQSFFLVQFDVTQPLLLGMLLCTC